MNSITYSSFSHLRHRKRHRITILCCEKEKVSSHTNFPWKHKFDQALDTLKNEGEMLAVRAQSAFGALEMKLQKGSLMEGLKNNEGEKYSNLALEFQVEKTFDAAKFQGELSSAAVFSIEQFSRLNGLTGKKMQAEFEAHTPMEMHNSAENFVEYCCFSFLSRNVLDIHPRLKDLAFRRLIFVTMLAWQQPYCIAGQSDENLSFKQNMVVSQAAFVRVAPAIAALADRAIAHQVFEVLVGDKSGLTFDTWDLYVSELQRVREGRELYLSHEGCGLDLAFDEHILCIGDSKQPILKWDKSTTLPGRLTLTDHSIYFEANIFGRHNKAMKFDLSGPAAYVEKTKVGPFGLLLFDTGVAIYSMEGSWTLEFISLNGKQRRDIWHACINEVISAHSFISEYGPPEDDYSLAYVYGATSGKGKAINSAANGIARLQALYSMPGLTLKDPSKYLTFSYIKTVPDGDLVYQTLAVEFWGGYLDKQSKAMQKEAKQNICDKDTTIGVGPHVIGSDGSIYLRKWMRSTSWSTAESIAFWKNNTGNTGVVFGKNLVVGNKDIVEKAVLHCRTKHNINEKTEATINAATLKGIPSNIDLFKELMLPIAIFSVHFKKLMCWEKPQLTILFLFVAYTFILRNWLHYIFPSLLIGASVAMLVIKVLRDQGKLENDFGKVTIIEKPSLNTFQKIFGLRDALDHMEQYLQQLNVMLLKLRTIFITGQTQVSYNVAFTLLAFGIMLIIFPFRYILAFFLVDLFTRELKFRQKSVRQFVQFLRNKWSSVPAAPVVVLPYDRTLTADMEETLSSNTVEKKTAEDSL